MDETKLTPGSKLISSRISDQTYADLQMLKKINPKYTIRWVIESATRTLKTFELKNKLIAEGKPLPQQVDQRTLIDRKIRELKGPVPGEPVCSVCGGDQCTKRCRKDETKLNMNSEMNK